MGGGRPAGDDDDYVDQHGSTRDADSELNPFMAADRAEREMYLSTEKYRTGIG